MKTCVIIPAYNESRTIAQVVNAVKLQRVDILVIDDGSSDQTSRIAHNSGATVITNTVNEGKGSSLAKGFQYALAHNFDAVITMDGDGQHSPTEIPNFIHAACASSSGMLIGNRMHDVRAMPWVRIITNKVMSWFISRIARQKIPDTQCGYRLIKREVLRQVKLKTSRFETDSEILLQSSRLGFKIDSVPITTIYRSEKSKINPFIDTIRFFRFIATRPWISRF